MKIFEDLFIFEMANNHQGDVSHGLKIIDAMGRIRRKHGIRAGVKFQYRNLNTFIHPDYRQRNDVKHISRFLDTELKDEEFLTFVDEVKKQEMIAIVTPFDEGSVSKCLDHGIDIIKVASCSATDWPLLETIVAARKPMIVSTGGLSIYQIDKVVSYLSHMKADFALLHCIGQYPTPNEAVGMGFLNRMKRRYPGIPLGYSGHEDPDNVDVVTVAVSTGARILERHVGFNTEAITLNKYSMNPNQTEQWVESALRARLICGDENEKTVSQEELDSLNSLKRGVYANKKIEKGAVIQKEDVFFAMPCLEGQVNSGEYGQYRTVYAASRNYEPGEPIHDNAKRDKISSIRSVIHDAKGMLFESGIALGKDRGIELSHHYGLDHFRQTGAVIVNMINRDYCKKLIILLPSQKHPNHRHRIKEETFQLLWGDLEVVIDGKVIDMCPGDKLLVEREIWHSFSSRNGAIMEEISTTHFRNDSEYEDETIDTLDPMERKTIIDDW